MKTLMIDIQKKFSDITWQPQQYLVSLSRYFKLCFCTQGLINPDRNGKYCTESSIHKVSVFVLTSRLTKHLCLNGRVGTEYNSLTANNVRRFSYHGLLAARSPILKVKVAGYD